jgi:hypothetical protein
MISGFGEYVFGRLGIALWKDIRTLRSTTNQIIQTPQDLQYPKPYPNTHVFPRKDLQPTASQHRTFLPIPQSTASLVSETSLIVAVLLAHGCGERHDVQLGESK